MDEDIFLLAHTIDPINRLLLKSRVPVKKAEDYDTQEVLWKLKIEGNKPVQINEKQMIATNQIQPDTTSFQRHQHYLQGSLSDQAWAAR